ncbi:MAG: hypothetical protein A4E49_03430 [Methanosaeta sp. PtaU1.Bin112]|nr:MAG: hypothetical protein A4E49_03430 [Methanosaeta sp. PtaU1.Bin112]
MCKHCGTNTGRIGFCVLCKDEICADCASEDNKRVHRVCSKNTIAIKWVQTDSPSAQNRMGVRGIPKAADRIER